MLSDYSLVSRDVEVHLLVANLTKVPRIYTCVGKGILKALAVFLLLSALRNVDAIQAELLKNVVKYTVNKYPEYTGIIERVPQSMIGRVETLIELRVT